jgi:hypothetical protein
MKPLQIFFLSFFLSSIQFVQAQSNIVAKLNNLNVNNDSKVKTIKINFSKCEPEDFDRIFTSLNSTKDFQYLQKKYSNAEKRGSLILSSSNKITTQIVEQFLTRLNIIKASFNNKNILVENLSDYEFTQVEINVRPNNLEN